MKKRMIDLNSHKETDRFAKCIAKDLFPGTIILLWGEMGSGKTTFAKSLCSYLGIQVEKVTSPTYTLVNIYQSHLPIYHVDLFRIDSEKELDDFDRQDLITTEGITLVEWPKFILSFLNDEPLLNLKFEALSSSKRRIKIESQSNDFDTIFMTLKQENGQI